MKTMLPLLIVASWISTANATEPFAAEIEDGSWVKYSVTVAGGSEGMMLETTIKAVGATQEAGVDCRWIEVASVDTSSGQQLEVFKLLFRDRDLQRGSIGISDVVRAWVIPRDTDQPEAANDLQLAPLAILFPGDLENEQRPDGSETVDLQGESLECGILEGETGAELGDQSITVSHRMLLHDEVPFGLAGFRKELRSTTGLQIVADAQLLERGEDAESLLPNSQ